MSSESKSVACPTCQYKGFLVLSPEEMPEGAVPEPNTLYVKCSACGQKFCIRWEGPVRISLAGERSGYDVSNLQVGDVLELPVDMGEIPAGLWAVTELGWVLRLARVGENEDGNLCMTHHTTTVTLVEAEQFVPKHICLEPPLDREW